VTNPPASSISWDELPLRPELKSEHPYGAPQLDVPVAINVNENPYPPSDQLITALTRALGQAATALNRYPDREATALRAGLAAYLGDGLTSEQVWAANGSNEIMIQLLTAFAGPGRSVMTFSPSYSMYPEYARDTNTKYRELPRRADFSIDWDQARQAIVADQPAILVLARPNNPTGNGLKLAEIETALALTTGLVLVDEAYQEFSGQPSAISLLAKHGRLVVTRTMSKAFAYAGVRLGYAAAAPVVIDALRVVRLPYHLSTLTQVAGVIALEHTESLLAQVDHLSGLRDQTIGRLRALGYEAVDSQANFFLLGRFADRHQVWQRLLDQGVLVRETGPAGYLRVSVGTDDDMERFIAALLSAAPVVARKAHP
jgi:histidinol-phosphate aminotransferase